MPKSYTDTQKANAKQLLENGVEEEKIEQTTGVSTRTLRRWKTELQTTGRIGKPPESRTGRHRVLSKEVEHALIEYAKDRADLSVDDMLWWLHDNYGTVVGTRTVRRVFERRGDKIRPGRGKGPGRKSSAYAGDPDADDDDVAPDEQAGAGALKQQMTQGQTHQQLPQRPMSGPPAPNITQYQSPYAPVSAPPGASEFENQFRQAMQHQPQPLQDNNDPFATTTLDLEGDLPDDEETLQLQLQQIALQKREVELKLKIRRLKNGATSTLSSPSTLYNPNAPVPAPSKRDSRSKKKIEESKRRTAERQERMLRDLERRSRRRDHLTADWVTSKDIWPLRAQGVLADLMHQYGYYTYSQNQEGTFDAMYHELYQLVDLTKGDWDPHTHDEMLRERMKRKIGQLRVKMQKTGEIIGRADGFPGFQKAENFTGQQAGTMEGDETELVQDPALQVGDALVQTQPGAPHMQSHDELQYDPSEQQLHQASMQYPAPMMHPQGHAQYLMEQHHTMMPYQMNQQGLPHQDNMVI